MTIEVLPVGTKCVLSCKHCYQSSVRKIDNNVCYDYDMEAMKRALSKENYNFSVFGGEPLLMPITDLEELWRWGKEKFGKNSIQTSGVPITDYHYELFQKYNVSVGISLDGPGELNDIRWAGSQEKTRGTTKKVENVLYKLLEMKHPVSLITTLHAGNTLKDRLGYLLDWFEGLDERGLRNVNLHLLEIEDEQVRKDWALKKEENTVALLMCIDLQSELKQLRFQPITDMTQLLLDENSKTICTWNACDPYTTRAVRGIDNKGNLINCSRVNKVGVNMQKADCELFIRPMVLFYLAQEKGGCQNCRFWFACKGSCPGQASDWRRKTEYCETLQNIFKYLETRLASLGFRPISSNEYRRNKIETQMITTFRSGKQQDAHGDAEHGDLGHGDHNDIVNPIISHGDHTDAPS